MPDKVGGVILFNLLNPAAGVTANIMVKGGTVASDQHVIAIANGYFTGVSVFGYEGRVTAGKIDFLCAKNGASAGTPAQLRPLEESTFKRQRPNSIPFNAGDRLQAIYRTSSDYADDPGTEFTVAVWFAYDYGAQGPSTGTATARQAGGKDAG
jgi:hypothetical protein